MAPEDHITPCWFRDRFGYKHRRLHWAWHKQWYAVFGTSHGARMMVKYVQPPCHTTEGDVEWASQKAKELGLM